MRTWRAQALKLRQVRAPATPTAVALGIFDGVHQGHRRLLEACVALARRDGLAAVALTFDPHPARLLRPEAAPQAIEPLEARLAHFAELGIDEAVVLPFDAELAGLDAAAFVDAVLGDALHAAHVVVGYDFAFGRGAGGSAASLREVGARGAGEKHSKFVVHQIEPVRVGEVVASSTAVRACVARGDVAGAAVLLGRPFRLYGEVVHGLQRGRTLGFPTANLQASAELVPERGIYAGWAHGSFGRRPAAVSVGVNPTFSPLARAQIEAHLLDYDGHEIYGEAIELDFVARLRGEVAYTGTEALVAQIARDCVDVRTKLGL